MTSAGPIAIRDWPEGCIPLPNVTKAPASHSHPPSHSRTKRRVLTVDENSDGSQDDRPSRASSFKTSGSMKSIYHSLPLPQPDSLLPSTQNAPLTSSQNAPTTLPSVPPFPHLPVQPVTTSHPALYTIGPALTGPAPLPRSAPQPCLRSSLPPLPSSTPILLPCFGIASQYMKCLISTTCIPHI